jgi:hypothetical protein
MLKRIFGSKRTSESHSISIMDSSGDRAVEWRVDDPASIAEAEKVFERIKRQGGAVFRVQPEGERGAKLEQFDPSEDMIAVPRIVGG